MLDMEAPFGIDEQRRTDGVPVLSVRGEIDVATAPELREHLDTLLAGGTTTVVVDLSAVTFMDSIALGVLVGAVNRCRQAGGDLPLVLSEPRIMKVFDITGLSEVFAISDSLEDAAT
jgi:anti-sigma B factor antagonist